MLTLVICFSALIAVSVQQTQGCNSPPLPDLNGACPPDFTIITGSGCCPNADVFTITTTPAATTTRAATTTKAATSGTGTTGSSTCVDLKNPNTGTSDCPNMKAYCTNSAYLTLMKQQCPKTCGYCSSSATTASSTCVDLTNPSTGTSDCTRMASYCKVAAYVTLMKQQCPKTCGYCSGSGSATTTRSSTSTCVDLTNPSTGTSDCARMAGYCNVAAYVTLMKQQCPKTCGYCTSG
uniref:ShKT domain-containing protein n=1 Tax=Caenorhabditis japonica TaxID=281687 RepID=A0A8R1HN66_CAEJA